MKKYFGILRKCSLFSDIEDQHLIAMLSCLGAKRGSFDKKYTIFAEGNPAKYIGILLSGSAQIVRHDYDGNRSIVSGIFGAFCTCWFGGVLNAEDLEYGLQYSFQEWFIWCSFIKSIFFAYIIASVSAYFGYTVEGGSIAVGKASTDSVVMSSVLILFSDLVLTQLLMG